MRRRSSSGSPPPGRGGGRDGRDYGGRDYGGRSYGRSPSPSRGRYGRRGDPPTSLLVRNIPRDCCRSEDLRLPFERYGEVKDVYLPRDYYTGEPRGFGFVQYMDPGDAAEAQYHMDHQVINGREITVVFAEENRKKPQEMRSKERIRGRIGGHGGSGRRRSPYYVRSRSRSPRHYSRSPRRERSRSYTPRSRAHDRSYSPPRSSRKRSSHHSHSGSPVSRKAHSRDRVADRKEISPATVRDGITTSSGGRRERAAAASRSPSASPARQHSRAPSKFHPWIEDRAGK